MDLNLIVVAQRLPANQFRFDHNACERAMMRAKKRRAVLRGCRTWVRGRIDMIHAHRNTTTTMAAPVRPG